VVLVECTALTIVAAKMIRTTSFDDYWMRIRNQAIPSMKCCYSVCATTSYIDGDQQMIEMYTEYIEREERQICDFVGMVRGKSMRYWDL